MSVRDWAYALPCLKINTHRSLLTVERARLVMPFSFQTIQSDHGSEFSKWFTKRIAERGIAHRHSRVRTPNDNAHLERFNRTLQEECLTRVSRSLRSWQKEIPEYLRYYNKERPHMGLNFKTPTEVMQSYWLENAQFNRFIFIQTLHPIPNLQALCRRVTQNQARPFLR